jgi:hypothetical protein
VKVVRQGVPGPSWTERSEVRDGALLTLKLTLRGGRGGAPLPPEEQSHHSVRQI